jgi:hypothetical protein
MRAPRFPLQLPVLYRALGGSDWRQARTGNVSASGVLVWVPDPLQVDTRIEFRLGLAEASQPIQHAEVRGEGRVVRVVSETEPISSGFAVAIESYDFQPTPSTAH